MSSIKIPKTEFEVFEQLVQRAHDTHGPYLPLQVKNELEGMAQKINYDFDEGTGDQFKFNS